MRCERHGVDVYGDTELLVHIFVHLTDLEQQMTEFANDQDHLDADVSAESTSFAQVLAELKAQEGADKLDFTKADAFVASVQSEAAADAPAPVQSAAVDPLAPTGSDAPHPSDPTE